MFVHLLVQGNFLTYPVASRIECDAEIRLVVVRILWPALFGILVLSFVIFIIAHVTIAVAIRIVSFDWNLGGLVIEVTPVAVDEVAVRCCIELVAGVIPKHAPLNDTIVTRGEVVDGGPGADVP
jgi:hypothetical protein